MSKQPDIILASTSPRRRELLGRLNVSFVQLDSGTEEILQPGESAEAFVLRLAGEKAVAGWQQHGTGTPALGADTVVVLDGRILGKPASRAEAVEMLESLSGRRHEVLSAVAVATGTKEVQRSLNRTAVYFNELPAAWISAYCDTPEPMDKAGAYAIQGGAGEYIERIEGSFSGVMGLPLDETRELLRRVGVLA